jgi:hypothetical protein
MLRTQKWRWVAEVHQSMRAAIGHVLQEQMEAPQELPPELAALVAHVANSDTGFCVSMPQDRIARSTIG